MTAHRVSLLGLTAGVVGGASTALYLALILGEEGGQPGGDRRGLRRRGADRSAAALAGSLPGPPRRRAWLLAGSAAIFLVWGILGLLSIGVLFVVAALLAAVAASRLR